MAPLLTPWILGIFCHGILIAAAVVQDQPAGTCNQALGLESGAIADGRITASSSLNERRNPRYARLHQRDGDGGWTVGPDESAAPRLTIDLGKHARVVAVATQGRYDSNEFVRAYKVAYSMDGATWHFVVASDNTEKTFTGNTNSDDVMKQTFPSPVEARYIRFMPDTYSSAISMRVELYGCITGAYSATFDGTNYMKWDLTRPRDMLNFEEELMEFYFLTSEPNGIIVSGYGTQGDYIVIALMEGKLQLSFNLGTNSLYSDGKANLTVGSLLDDNHWHRVRYVRDRHQIKLYLDGTKVRGEAMGDFEDLNLDKELTLGGASDQAKVLYNIENNFKGCVQNVLISESTDTSLLGIALDFVKEVVVGGRLGFSMVGTLQQGCSSSATTSITFPTTESYLKWMVQGSSNNFTVHVRFRTFDEDSLIMYNAMNSGYIALGLRSSVFVVAIMDGGNQAVDTPAGYGLNDGLWHRVRVEVAAGRVHITVDGIEQETARSTSFVSTSTEFYIGGSTLSVSSTAHLPGFRGCVSELYLQGSMVDFATLESSSLPSGVVNNMVQVDTCGLDDWCSPTPCEHGGKCTSDWDTFVCDCTDTGYIGAVCHTSDYYHLCEHIGQNGEDTVDIDGSGPLPPFVINCNIDVATAYHWTEISHDTEVDMDVPSQYTTPGSYQKRIEYSATLDQIDELTKSSEMCEQYIKYQCTRSILLNSPDGAPYGWWVSRHDQMMVNWGGAAAGTGRCACGVDMTCLPDNSKYCNCDAINTNDGVDEGLLIEKDYLPVTQLRFGLSGTNPAASFGLGKLRCRGDKYLANTVSFVKREAHLRAHLETTPQGAFDISFEFKTTFDPSSTQPPSSAVFFAARAEDDGLIEVKLMSDRTVQLQFDYGADMTSITSSANSPLNDDEWHSIRANFDRKEVWLQVDSSAQETATLPRPELMLELEGPLFIGASTLQADGYIGCMRKMMANGDHVDMMDMAEDAKDVIEGCVGQCSTQPCLNGGTCMEKYDSVACSCTDTAFTGMYCSREVGIDLSGDSMVTYDLPVSLQQQTTMDTVGLAFKTDLPGGQIFRVVSNGDSSQMRLSMDDAGNVMFEAQLGTTSPVSLTQNRNFADDKNHFVRITRNGLEFSFQIDDYLAMKGTGGASTFTPSTIYIGGSDSSFVGCISRVQFNTIYPLKDYMAATPPTGLSSTGTITGSHCGIHEEKPMLLPSEEYPPEEEEEMITEGNMPSAKPVGASLAAGDKAAIAIVVLLLCLALFLLLFLIGRYTSRHKGMYTTNEDKGAKNATTADDAIALQGSKRSKEYYM